MSEHTSPDDLQGKLRQVREDLDSHSEEVVQRIRSQLDWRNIVAEHPLVALGAAATAGYLLAPRRAHCQCVRDKAIKETLEQAMERSGSAAPRSMATGLVAGLASVVMATLVREGLSFASQFLRDYFDSQAADRKPQADDRRRPDTWSQGATNGKH
jgi:hypothetical protein